MWRHAAAMPIPDDLAYKVALYRLRGEVVTRQYDHFSEPSWISIYNGQGLVPQSYDPLADRLPVEQLRALMEQRRDTIRGVVNRLPSHAAFIAQHCASPNFMMAALATEP